MPANYKSTYLDFVQLAKDTDYLSPFQAGSLDKPVNLGRFELLGIAMQRIEHLTRFCIFTTQHLEFLYVFASYFVRIHTADFAMYER